MIIKSFGNEKALTKLTGLFSEVGIISATATVTASLMAKIIKSLGSEVHSNIYRTDITNYFTNITQLAYSVYKFYFGNFTPHAPAAVVGGIPLASVEEISHAMSDRILKYRATGGIFLAHQEGGEQTLRIVGKAWGPNRYLFLIFLDMLFLYGSSKMVDVFAEELGQKIDFGVNMEPEVQPWQIFDLHSLDEGTQEKHLTFPIVTSTRIYTNMYIETYEFTESVEEGMDCVTYSLFFRKYVPDYPYRYYALKTPQGNVEWYYRSDVGDENINTFRLIDKITDVGFSLAMLMYRIFQFAAGNSPEKSLALVSSLNLINQTLGYEKAGSTMKMVYDDIDYDFSELSTKQKAEVVSLD